MLKIALIGLGNMGKLHLKNILKLESNKLCTLSCICDKNRELTDRISSEINVKGYYSAKNMLNGSEFDAAIVAVNSSEHLKVAKVLLNGCKPILIEKPVVISMSEAEELYKISQAKNVLVSPGYTEVYNSVTTGIENYLNEHKHFHYIDFYRIGQKSKRNDTKDIDVIQDLMTHDLAVVSQIIDLKTISTVGGNLSSYNEKSKMYDLANVSLSFDNGAIVRFLCDRGSSAKIRKFNISSDDIYGEFDFMDQTASIMKKGNIEAFGENIWYFQKYDAVKVRYANNPLYDEIKDFILAVQNSKKTKVSENWFYITKTIESIRKTLYKRDMAKV